MKVFSRNNDKNDLLELLPQAIARLKKNIIEPFFGEINNAKYAHERLPLRAEIFTQEKLEQHAVALAKRHVLTYEKTSEQLLKRLAENEQILLEVYALLTDTLKETNSIAPAAEWLLSTSGTAPPRDAGRRR